MGYRAKHVGRVRKKLAQMIEKALTAEGHSVRVDPKKLWPNQGYWRTDYRADVQPWEGQIEIQFPETGRWHRVGVSSWDKMTDLIKGFTIQDGNRHLHIDLDAENSAPHPALARSAMAPKG